MLSKPLFWEVLTAAIKDIFFVWKLWKPLFWRVLTAKLPYIILCTWAVEAFILKGSCSLFKPFLKFFMLWKPLFWKVVTASSPAKRKHKCCGSLYFGRYLKQRTSGVFMLQCCWSPCFKGYLQLISYSLIFSLSRGEAQPVLYSLAVNSDVSWWGNAYFGRYLQLICVLDLGCKSCWSPYFERYLQHHESE